MKNADQPIHPIENIIEFGDGHKEKRMYIGLSKREYFAAMAMQGICANSAIRSDNTSITKVSVSLADELLKQLEK